jgi:hypothetical protein
MTVNPLLAAASVAVLLSVGASAAQAAVVSTPPLPVTAGGARADVGFDNPYVIGSGSLTAEAGSSSYDTASATVVYEPEPAVTASISGSVSLGASNEPYAYADSTYAFEIVGPTDTNVPINVVASISSYFSTGSNFSLEGYETIYSTGTRPFGMSLCPASAPEGCQQTDVISDTLSYDGVVDFSANTIYYVESDVSITLDSYTGPFSASIVADPAFTIDPTFLAANPGYSLQFSSGVSDPPSAAPEPTAWALMILGLGAAGGLLRRRDDILNLSRRVVATA